jgi:hypothetical protein
MPEDDIGKQMQAFHATQDLMAAIHGPGCLNNAPDGEEMRLPDARTKPWEKLGISRATWYRQGKPKMKYQLFSERGFRDKNAAKSWSCSVRSYQRQIFVSRYGIHELYALAYHGCLPRGMLEEIAKWEHADQRRFVDQLAELARPLPADSRCKEDQAYYLKEFGPVMGILLRVNPRALKRVAQRARREIEASWYDAADERQSGEGA